MNEEHVSLYNEIWLRNYRYNRQIDVSLYLSESYFVKLNFRKGRFYNLCFGVLI